MGPDTQTALTAQSATHLVGTTTTTTTALSLVVDLARLGPHKGPNPRVGCILLAPGPGETREIIAVGWHRGVSTPHAEAAALQHARDRGVDTTGATAVVSLEPCNHTGRTGPCSRALIDAGISQVLYAVADPNPLARGGAHELQAAGIDVTGPLDPSGRAHELLAPWLKTLTTDQPFVTLKLATTLDGRIAASDGTSRWITSTDSRNHAHAYRREVDAIAVGTTTALVDDPTLTARPAPEDGNQPMRVVIGNRPLPAAAKLNGPGGQLLQIRSHDPAHVLEALREHGVQHLLVEGGPTLASAFLRAQLVDRVHAYIAPVLLGAGPPATTDLAITTITGAIRLNPTHTRTLGPDIFMSANIRASNAEQEN